MMENRADRDAERGLAVVAAVAVLARGSMERSAVGADRFAPPAGLLEVGDAIFLCWEPLENLYDVHIIPLPFEATSIFRQDQYGSAEAECQDLKLGNPASIHLRKRAAAAQRHRQQVCGRDVEPLGRWNVNFCRCAGVCRRLVLGARASFGGFSGLESILPRGRHPTSG